MMPSFLRAAALLALCVPAAGDTLFHGFKSEELPIHDQVAFDVLADGRYVTMDGQSCDLWAADGNLIMNLAAFPVAGETGAMAIHPTETWVLVGERLTGQLYRIELDGSGLTQLASLQRNTSIAWETNQFAIISAATGSFGPAFELWRLNISSGALEVLATLPGQPGPIAIDSTDSVFCATVSNQFPVPAGSSDIYRFQPSVLDGIDPNAPVTFDDDGVLVLQIESVDAIGDWSEETSKPGFTGESYFRWTGPNFFNTPGNSTLSWDFEVNDADDYQLRIYNLHDHPDSTLENDCWVRIDGGSWEKVYSGGFVDEWNWASKIDHEDPVPDEFPIWFLTPGAHTIEVSGRSTNYRIDRMHLYKVGAPNSQDLSKPHSAPIAPSEADAQLLFENLDNVTSMVVEPEMDTLFIAESNVSTGVSVIHMFGKVFPSTPIMLDASGEAALGNLRFVRQNAPGAFFPFQPPNTGQLHVGRFELGTGDPQRFVIETQRPELSITGPGTFGNGDFTMAMDDGWNHGFYFLLFDSLANYNPVESTLNLQGIPVLHTGMGFSTMIFVNLPIPLDGNGSMSLTLTNNTGLTNFGVFQLLIGNTLTVPVGSSTAAFL